MSDKLTPKNARLIKQIAKGNNITEASAIVCYNRDYATTLLKKAKMVKALDKEGLTDKAVAKGLKTNIQAGLAVKATASDSLRGLELASKLRGHQDTTTDTAPKTQTNVYINELNNMADGELHSKVDELQQELNDLK